MKNNIFTMVRKDQEGIDVQIYVDMYEIPEGIMEDSNDINVMELFYSIAKDYLKTDEGKKELEYNSGNYNWNDFAYIPNEFFEKYGVKSLPVTSNICREVDANESLL